MKRLEVDLSNNLSPPGIDFYRFGEFLLDPRKRTLSRGDSTIVLTPKAFDVLIFLVQNPHRLLTKDEVLQAVWADTFVEEGTLAQYISHLRKALGDTSESTRLIVTIARKGYQFTADVAVAETTDTSNLTLPAPWLGSGCLGRATGRPTWVLSPLERVSALHVKPLSER
jgi:DNA-binding winged helix-turn-helix (wHTH) protein